MFIKNWKIFNEEYTSNNKFRVYKKTKDYYIIEIFKKGSWIEIMKEIKIENLLLKNCHFFVDESGRIETVSGEFKSSKDVPVHAWIECEEFQIGGKLENPDGILYYNPFTVRKFMDRKSYENGIGKVIESADFIGIKGNFLTYRGYKSKIDDKSILDKKISLTESKSVNWYF